MLWELRAGILQQAIPLCLSFCLSVLNSPSALIHSHIQFPALSIHQSPQFVSADFIAGLTITLQPSQAALEPPPPAAPPAPRSADRGPGRAACPSLLHRPAKTLILNLIPIVLLFTFPTEGNARETATEEREKPRGGGAADEGRDNGERCLLNFLKQFAHQSGGGSIQLSGPHINRNHRKKM